MVDNPVPPSYTIRRKPLPRRWQVDGDDTNEGEESFPLVHIQHRGQESQAGRHKLHPQSPESIRQRDLHVNLNLVGNDNGRNVKVPDTSIERYSDLSASDRPQLGDTEGAPKRVSAGSLTGRRGQSLLWNTKWLHRTTLLGFCCLFAAILLALVLLYHFAQVKDGLSTQETSNHYAWTYGPTALLVFVLGGWRQVDFNCQILAPWKHAIEGPTTLEKSLFLDYISLIAPVRLWRAFRNHDWAVFASTLGVLLLRIVIVFSTGLLVLTPTTMSDDNTSLKTSSKIVAKSVPEFQTDDPLMEYYGILSHKLDYPYGTTESVAFQTIDLSSALPNSTINVTVEGFFPHFDCQVSQVTSNFTWKYDQDLSLDQLWMNVTAQSSLCPPFSGPIRMCQPTTEACPSEISVLDVLPNSVEVQPWYNFNAPIPATEPCANAWRFVYVQFSYQRNESAAANSSLGWNVEIGNLSVAMCAPSYSIQPLNVTIDVSGTNIAAQIRTTKPATRTTKQLDGFSISDFNSLLGNQFSFVPNHVPSSEYYTPQMHILSLQNGNSSMDAFLDPETLRDTVSHALEGIGAQGASYYLRSLEEKTVTGTVTFEEQRLQVRLLSVCVMAGALALLIICAVVVLAFRAHSVISRNPNSIATNAAILASSFALNQALSNSRHLSDEALHEHMYRTMIRSQVTNTPSTRLFSVDVPIVMEHGRENERDTERELAIGDTRQGVIWWRPFSITSPFMAWAIFLPLSVIVVLEILQRLSETRQGIANMSFVSAPGREAGSLLSSLVMIITAMTYDSMEFAVATLAPYRSLRRESATGTRCLLGNDIGQMTIASIIRPLKNGHPSIALAPLAAVIGSWLAIIASGLYTIEPVLFVSSIDVIGTDRFINTWNSSSDNAAGSAFTLLEHRNASYPDFTFDEVAIPVIEVPLSDAVNESSNNVLQVVLTARRASLNCTVVPQANTSVSTVDNGTPDSGTDWFTIVDWVAGVPDSCAIFQNQSNVSISSIPFTWSVQHGNGSDSSMHSVLSGGIIQAGSFGSELASNIGASTNGPGCPSLAFFFGLLVLNSTSTENITAMTCVQGLEDIETNTTFMLPEMTIPTYQPPDVYEHTAKWVASEDYVGPFMTSITFDQYNSTGVNGINLDGFIQNVLYGTEGIPPVELLGPANAGWLVDAIQHVYRKYMAQVINLNMREPIKNDVAKPSYPAFVLDSSHHLRLKQNNKSKIVLQTLLGVMALCAVLIYVTCFDMRHTLQQCPWSMAGVMNLLAGSEICKRSIMPEGAEFMTDKELEAVLQGWQFNLGWWETQAAEGQGPPRFGIGVRKRNAK
jgi:hypothetical protein